MEDYYKHQTDERKIRFKKNITSKGKENAIWIVTITILSFIFSSTLLFASTLLINKMSRVAALLTVLFIICIGILFDIIGIAFTASDEVPFHAMAARKFYGAKKSIRLIRNANKVSSFCNDVVGDICGIISGTASAYLVISLSRNADSIFSSPLSGPVIGGLVAAFTVGGKALGKTFAIRNSNLIVYRVSTIIQFFTFGKIKLKFLHKKENLKDKCKGTSSNNRQSNAQIKTKERG